MFRARTAKEPPMATHPRHRGRPVLRLDGEPPTADLASTDIAHLSPDRVTVPHPGARSPLPTDHGVPPA